MGLARPRFPAQTFPDQEYGTIRDRQAAFLPVPAKTPVEAARHADCATGRPDARTGDGRRLGGDGPGVACPCERRPCGFLSGLTLRVRGGTRCGPGRSDRRGRRGRPRPGGRSGRRDAGSRAGTRRASRRPSPISSVARASETACRAARPVRQAACPGRRRGPGCSTRGRTGSAQCGATTHASCTPGQHGETADGVAVGQVLVLTEQGGGRCDAEAFADSDIVEHPDQGCGASARRNSRSRPRPAGRGGVGTAVEQDLACCPDGREHLGASRADTYQEQFGAWVH